MDDNTSDTAPEQPSAVRGATVRVVDPESAADAVLEKCGPAFCRALAAALSVVVGEVDR